MKNSQFAILVAILVVGLAWFAFAQSYGSISFGVIAPTLANCQPGAANMATLCAVGSGGSYTIYVSYSGTAYQLLVPASGGVSSWDARTGAVTPQTGDYTYSMLGSPPTTVNCGTFSITGTALTASGCTIK